MTALLTSHARNTRLIELSTTRFATVVVVFTSCVSRRRIMQSFRTLITRARLLGSRSLRCYFRLGFFLCRFRFPSSDSLSKLSLALFFLFFSACCRPLAQNLGIQRTRGPLAPLAPHLQAPLPAQLSPWPSRPRVIPQRPLLLQELLLQPRQPQARTLLPVPALRPLQVA